MAQYLFLTGPDDYYAKLALRLADELAVTPSVWIGKKQVTDFARHRFPECLVLDISDVISEPTPSRQLNNSEFAMLSEYWDSHDFLSYRINLTEEFNRYPSLDSLTMMERDALIRNMQVTVVQAIQEKKPDFVISLHPPHNPLSLAAWHFCEWLGLPSLFFRSAGNFAPILLPSTTILGRVPYEFAISSTKDRPEPPGRQAIRLMAARVLDELRAGDTTGWQRNEQERLAATARSRFHRINDFRQDVNRALGRFRDPESATLRDYLETRYRQLSEAHALLPDRVEGESFGYFALHYQPEATSVPQGLEDVFQGEAVRKARALLPSNIPLFVKEHPSQISWELSGFRGRAASFYSFVNSLPNTTMVSAHSPNNQLMQGACVIFTLTGTIGLEAAIKGIPVVYFGLPWWEGLPGTRPYENTNSPFEEWVPNPAKQGDVWDFLERLAAEKGIPHYVEAASDDWGLSEKDLTEISEGFLNACVEMIGSFIEGELERRRK